MSQSEPPNPRAEYARRLELRRAALSRQDLHHRRIGNMRLAIFVAAAVMTWFALFRSAWFSTWWLAAPAGIFAGLVFVHGKVLAEHRRLLRAVAFYERGLARLQGRWRGTGNQGDRFIDESHPYAQDLDIFGKGSLFELISGARTRAGEEKLAGWLKFPADADEVRSRQSAVAELRSKSDMREDLAVLGAELNEGVDPHVIFAWGSAAPVLTPGPKRVAAGIIAALTVASLSLWAITGDHRWFLLMLFIELIFAFLMRPGIRRVVNAVEEPGRELELLSLVLGRLEKESFKTPRLAELRRNLESRGAPPSRRIAQLNRLIVLLDSRRNMFFMPVAAILLWEIQFAYAIEDWRRETGPAIGGWLSAVAELEALSSLAGYAYEHPDNPFPEVCDDSPCFLGEELRHPLMDENRCVPNSVRLGGELRAFVVSGSNMSGKSTLLRTVGTNAVLALAGAPVCARRLCISPLAVGASIRTLDSLQEGNSRFYAEIRRLRKLVDLADGRVPLLFLIDELLQGTNSHDRRIGADAVVKGFLRRGAIGLLTTHDLALSEIAEDLAPRAENVHFEDQVENGKILFDYVLRPGVVRKSNALELMRSIGLEV